MTLFIYFMNEFPKQKKLGPNNPEATPVDAWTFLMLCRTRFPKAIISIGWTTNLDGQMKTGYSREMVDHMASLVREYNLMQPLTFPVNATLLKYSICEIQRLLFQVCCVCNNHYDDSDFI